jgi:hypothetical protein
MLLDPKRPFATLNAETAKHTCYPDDCSISVFSANPPRVALQQTLQHPHLVPEA